MENLDEKYLSEPVRVPNNANLQSVSELAAQQVRLEKVVSELEEELKERKKELLKVSDELLPNAMENLGLEEFKLADGSTISIKDLIAASIPKDKEAEAFAWLRENGYADIIKNTVSCSFGKDEDELAKEALEKLKELGFKPNQASSVHPSTLKAFVKECLEEQVAIPLEPFGVWQGKRASVKLPKS